MMQTTAIVAAAFAALATAQVTDFNNLAGCGKVCIPNMLGQWQSLGCSSAQDVSCLCGNDDYMNGIRDCIEQACPPSDQEATRNYAASICQPGSNGGNNAPVGAGSVMTITRVDGSGMTYTTVSTFNGGQATMTGDDNDSDGMLITTTDSAGSTYTTSMPATETDDSDSDGGAIVGAGGATLTFTDDSGNTMTTTVASSMGASPAVTTLTATDDSGNPLTTTITGEDMDGAAAGGMVLTTTDDSGNPLTTTVPQTGMVVTTTDDQGMTLTTSIAPSETNDSDNDSNSDSSASGSSEGSAPRATAVAGLLGLAAFVAVL